MSHWPKRRERMFHARCAQRPLAGHLTREGSSQHGLQKRQRAHMQRICHFGVVRVAPTLLCTSSQWTLSAWSACVTREIPARTRMALIGHFGSCTHAGSSSQCPPCFLTSFHTRSLTCIYTIARTPEECPHRACPQCIPERIVQAHLPEEASHSALIKKRGAART